jgi:hypothetical protein
LFEPARTDSLILFSRRSSLNFSAKSCRILRYISANLCEEFILRTSARKTYGKKNTIKILMKMTENDISYKIRGAVFKVFTKRGPGLLESVYEAALTI